MAYSELIKDYQRVRDYMRQFYVYGFKSREEYDAKSARSYDNERRRIESWLGEYMSFRQNAGGKQVFLCVDSRAIPHNPLYKSFKAKSFTDKDITLHFCILDLLADGGSLTVKELVGRIADDYLSRFEREYGMDESTVRKKLKEYEELGLLVGERRGRERAYRLAEDGVELEAWKDAIAFFSEESPLGVVGSYLQDRQENIPDYYIFKHHYLLHALDSDLLCAFAQALREKRCVDILIHSPRSDRDGEHRVYPLKIYISAQTGREYLLGYHYRFRKPMFYRVDTIVKVSPGPVEQQPQKYEGCYEKFAENLWGVATGAYTLDHVELTVHIGPGEAHILQRLNRERRVGRVEAVGPATYKFIADVYDGEELLPWVRTFIGRIQSFSCSSAYVQKRFYDDLHAMLEQYGGEDVAVP